MMKKIEKPETKSLNFRDKKHLFLTYSQCPISKENMFTHILSTLKDNVVNVAVCSETHEDGNPHLHAFIELEKTIRHTRADILDYFCPIRKERYHPNIGPVRDIKAAINYLQKEDKEPICTLSEINDLIPTS